MKQFFKQLGIGVAMVSAIVAVVAIICGAAVLVTWIMGRVNIDGKLLLERVPWIVAGVIITILLELLGILGYWMFWGRKDNPEHPKKKKSTRRRCTEAEF